MGIPEPFQIRSFRFTLRMLAFYRELRRTSDLPASVLKQVLRAGTSIGANIAEAKSAYSRRDLAAKYAIALRESRECNYWLRLIAADQPSSSQSVHPLIEESDQFIAMLTQTVKHLRQERASSAINR
jgi:four helix bundle protein